MQESESPSSHFRSPQNPKFQLELVWILQPRLSNNGTNIIQLRVAKINQNCSRQIVYVYVVFSDI